MANPTEILGAGSSVETLLPGIEVVFGQSYFDLYAEEFDLGSNLLDHATSGDVELALGEIAPGSNVTRAVVRVGGEAYRGLLKDFRGTRVTRSPLVFDSKGAAAPSVSGQRAFIIDFAGVRSVLGLALPANKGKIVLVLPWMGTDFAPRAIYPIGGAYAIYSLPVPDTTGKTSVGFPAVETAKLFVQVSGSGLGNEVEFANEVRTVTGVLPSNLRASVNERPVFFTRPNALDREVELAGLADELNAIARELKAPAAVTLKLATDTPGALLPTFAAETDLEIERSAAARWGGRDALDVPLAGLMPIPVDMVFPSADAVPWQFQRIALELGGSFPRWRAFGPAGTPTAKLGLKVSAQFSVARRIELPGRTQMHGVALLLSVAGKTEMRLEFAADADGAPADGTPLATVDLVLEGDGSSAAWYEALAESPFDSGAATTLWVVLKGKSGATEWAAQSETSPQPPATLYANEGGRWQRYPVRAGQSPAPFLRILREPLARENAPLVTAALASATGAVTTVAADSFEDAPKTLDLALPEGEAVTVTPAAGMVVFPVLVTAAASGTLEIRRATAYFTTE